MRLYNYIRGLVHIGRPTKYNRTVLPFCSGQVTTVLRSQWSETHAFYSVDSTKRPTSQITPPGNKERAFVGNKVRGIQKDLNALTTRRVVRRKRRKDAQAYNLDVFNITAFATAEELDIESLRTDMEKLGLYKEVEIERDEMEDVLYAEAAYKVDNETRSVFFFREGCVVFWNMPVQERTEVLASISKHQIQPYDKALIEQEFEDIDFSFAESPTKIHGSHIYLRSIGADAPEADLRDQQLERYTFSNAIALSVKLAIWEESLARYVESIDYVLDDMRAGKRLRITREEVLRKSGELFNLRHLINLSSDLLDTPDFYWDRERLETLYTRTCAHFNIARRTRVINEKLSHCCELTDLLTSHLSDKHHTRLEVMIIVLILIEVLFEVAKWF